MSHDSPICRQNPWLSCWLRCNGLIVRIYTIISTNPSQPFTSWHCIMGGFPSHITNQVIHTIVINVTVTFTGPIAIWSQFAANIEKVGRQSINAIAIFCGAYTWTSWDIIVFAVLLITHKGSLALFIVIATPFAFAQ